MPLPESPPTGHLPFEPPIAFPPDMAEFWHLWREEKFWACHEALEDVWRGESGPRKHFLNGLIHCAVAVFQHRRGNFVGAGRQEVRALVKLKTFRPSYDGLNVDGLLRGIHEEIASSLEKQDEKQWASLRELEARLEKKYSGDFFASL